jgi:subtilisin family serine protease
MKKLLYTFLMVALVQHGFAAGILQDPSKSADYVVVKVDVDSKAEKRVEAFMNGLDEAEVIKIPGSNDSTERIYIVNKVGASDEEIRRLEKFERRSEKRKTAPIVENETENGLDINLGEYILCFKDHTSKARREQILAEKKIIIKRISRSDSNKCLIYFKGLSVEEAKWEASTYDTSAIKYIESNSYMARKTGGGGRGDDIADVNFPFAPNDALIKKQWHFSLLNLFAANATDTACWKLSKGEGVVVAVLDDGVDINHPDFKERIYKPYDCISEGAITVDSVETHGTACAGIIAATGEDSMGIAGIACNASVMPITIFFRRSDRYMDTFPWVISEAIRMAVDSGANVINCSWEVDSQKKDVQAISDAIDYAIKQNRVVILAAGNNGGKTLSYPATLGISRDVITVGALDFDGLLKLPNEKENWGSQYGEGLTVCAPGVGIYSTMSSNAKGFRYDRFSGTSFAAPIVAGTVALMLAANPSLTPAKIKELIMGKSFEIKDDPRLSGYKYRRLNITESVKAAKKWKAE